MSRLTFISFILLTGFFYVTGKPVGKTDQQINRSAEVSSQAFVSNEKAKLSNAFAMRGKEPKLLQPAPSPLQIHGIASARNIMPELPSRNPRRQNLAPSEMVIATATGISMVRKDIVAKVSAKIITPKKPVRNLTFADVRNKSTSSTTKPLAVSYKQRYVKAEKPVLGPRLTAILLKRELRRVGCYDGTITSSWDGSARNAIKGFNLNANNNLTVKMPTATALEQVQQTAKTVCIKRPSTGRTVIANATRAVKKNLVTKKVRRWKPKLLKSKRPVRKAALFTKPKALPPVSSPKRTAYTKSARKRVRIKRRGYRAIAKRVRRKQRYVRRKQRYARRTVRRRTAVRSWKRTYRRRRFRFRRSGMEFSIGN